MPYDTAPETRRMKYFYIMGRGHSGSTVLDAMLGNAGSIESVGELLSAMDRLHSQCSCGLPIKDCQFWTSVQQHFVSRSRMTWEDAASAIRRQAHITHFFPLLLKSKKSINDMANIVCGVADAVRMTSHKEAMLESSKTPTWALFLVLNFSESRIIHLVKHPAGIQASNYWRFKSGKKFQFLRYKFSSSSFTPLFLLMSSFAWLFGNLLAELVKIRKPSQVIRLRYEDIVEDPATQFSRLSAFLGVDLSGIARAIEDGAQMTFGHNIGGNFVRMEKFFTFDGKKGSARPLPVPYKIMVSMICWPLMLRYGYRSLRP